MLRFILLPQVNIQESSHEDNGKFNFLEIFWEHNRSWRGQAYKEPKLQNFGNHDATSGIYWVYYKSPISSYS